MIAGTSKTDKYYEAVGVIEKACQAPHFFELVFKIFLDDCEENTLFTQIIDDFGITQNMNKLSSYSSQIIFFGEGHIENRILRIGDKAKYAINYGDLDSFDKIRIHSGINKACIAAISQEKIPLVEANPFFGISVSQIANSLDMEVHFLNLAMGILSNTNKSILENWLSSRNLSDEARKLLNSSKFFRNSKNSSGLHRNENINIKVAVLKTFKNIALRSRYFIEEGLFISLHVGDAGFLFKGRTSNYDFVAGPTANFLNDEDIGDISIIPIVPYDPSPIRRKQFEMTNCGAYIIQSDPEINFKIRDIVVSSLSDKDPNLKGDPS